MAQPETEQPLDRDLDALIGAGDAARAGDGRVDRPDASKRRAAALHRTLQEPPSAGATPNLTPIVMARIARKMESAPTASPSRPTVAARLRTALAHLSLGPVAAVGTLAAVLAIALFAAGGAPSGPLSGAAVGVAAPSLAALAAVVLAVGSLAWWLRRR